MDNIWAILAKLSSGEQRNSAQNLNPNPGYHLMVMVIGVSTTVEYALKSAYETLIGRLTEASASAH